jgi:hypothetical protein
MPEKDFDQKLRDFRIRQKLNPVSSEQLEHNLRMTKIRRVIDWPPQKWRASKD